MPVAAIGQVPAPVGASGAADVVVNMHDVDIAVVADQISRITGRTLILDPQVRGQVNVTSAEPLTASGVWELFQSVLRVHGFAAVKTGRVWRIVPQASAVREAASGPVSGGQVVTRLVRLRNLAPETAARIFRPLVAQFGSIEPLTNPNAIVVTDYADNARRIERLAASLDGSGGQSFDSIVLKRASAADVGEAIRGLYGSGDSAPRIAVDEHSNTVMIRGDARSVGEARRMALQLDRPSGSAPTTRVFRLKYADSESITQILSGLIGAESQANNPVARALSPGSAIGAGLTGIATNTSSLAATALAGSTGATTNSTGTGALVANNNFGTTSSTAVQGSGFSTPDLAVQSAPDLNAIVVRGTPPAIAQIEPLIEQLDVRRPQVMIEAAIAEISGDKAEALGVQFGIGQGLPGVNGAVSSFSNIGVPLTDLLTALDVPIGAFAGASGFTGAISSHDNFQMLVQALGTSTKANLLSTPSVTTLDNQAAQIIVGQNVPFRSGSYTNAAGTTTTIERQDVGLTLRVVPRVHEGDTIRLEVSQEVSSIGAAVTGAADIVTNRRAIQTTVLANDGQTIVLGGLITDDQNHFKSQVPVLGDIPVLGNLFKSHQIQQTRRTLFVFLRPTILRDAAQVAAAADGKYARLRGAEGGLASNRSLLLDPPKARLPVEIQGVY
jgi:general secretion pathway protein D